MAVTKSKILKYIKSNDLMALSTSSNDKPWSCSLLFVNDKDFNFYIYSERSTLHSKNFSENPFVAFSINHEESKGEFEGLQISGKVEDMKVSEIPKVVKLFIKKFPYSKGWFSKEKLKLLFSKVGKPKLYKIKATKIYYLEKGNFSKRKLFSM